MQAFGDGDHVCITSDYFENLQESPAVFLPAENPLARLLLLKHGFKRPELYEEIENLRSQLLKDVWPDKRHCPNWGIQPNGNMGPCGDCEWCELAGYDDREGN